MRGVVGLEKGDRHLRFASEAVPIFLRFFTGGQVYLAVAGHQCHPYVFRVR